MVLPADEMLERRRGAPCSQAQRRFWVLDRLDPGDPALNVAVRWRLEGSVPVAAVERAFRLILARHEVLRSYFETADGEPVQLVAPQVSFSIPFIDLSASPPAEALAEAERIARVEARASFELTTPPLIRVTLLQVARDLSYLLVTAHHTVCDGWSIGILAREFGEICAAAHAGRIPALPELPVSYSEFAEWQNLHLAGNTWQHEVDYWAAALKGVSYFEIAGDRPHPPTPTNASEIATVLLERALTRDLEKLAHDHECTLFMTVLAALFTLLHRYTGETDITIGTQVAGRDEVELEHLVGVFINTLILRGNLGGDPTFAELLGRARDLVSGAYEHPHVAMEKLIEILKPRREHNRNPFFSINFIYQRSFIENRAYGSFKLVDVPSFSAGALYDLNFFMVERPEGWRLSCEYQTDLFERATVDRLLQHLQNLLRAVIAAPHRPIATLPMLGESEMHRLITELNRTETDYPSGKTVPEMLSEQAARTPHATALVFEDAAMTYAELDARSNRLAHHLRGLGVEPGVLVAVCMERSLDLLVALCGVLKAGGAYVPLDPAFPQARLTFMMEDSGARVLLTQHALRDRLTEHDAHGILLDRDWPSIAASPATSLDSGLTPDNLAYVIYTSGSTGRPKGVRVPHRGVVNLLTAMAREPGLTAKDVLLAVTTVSFDIAALELFLPLTVGARLVIAAREEAVDGAALLHRLKQAGVTVMQATPAAWRLLLEAGFRPPAGFRMLCGGEALPRELADRLLAGEGELWNMYGPTETTIWSSYTRIRADGRPITVGRPLANTQFYVLDGKDQPTVPGVPGQLHIGGAGLAQGYHKRPELTAEKFLPNPFGPGSIYRAGDLARWLPDGTMQILGRIDHQVKVRGFRIELGEVESVLRGCEGVRNAAVVVRTDVPGDARLVAYLVTDGGAGLPVAELRAQLGARLPEYMIPSAFVPLDALPLLPNGKLDRAALPAPSAHAAAASPAPALDPLEARLAALWRDVLHCGEFGRTANFFELGGHSLLAARLLGRIRAEFGQHLTLANMFKSPTLAEQAALLRRGNARDFEFRQVLKLQPNGSRPAIVAVHNTGIFYNLVKRLGSDQPFTSLQLFDPAVAGASLPDSVEAIAAGYVDLIRRVQPKGPYILTAWCIAGVLAFEVARQLQERGEQVPLLIVMDTWAPEYLKRLPWLQANLAEYCYRWKFIALEWDAMRAGRLSLKGFILNRVFVKRVLRLFQGWGMGKGEPQTLDWRVLGDEGYDRWLLENMERLARKYHPRPVKLHVCLLRASEEPGGGFLDRDMGWRDLALDGVTTVMVEGNHFTMFQLPGVENMAEQITRRVDALARQAP